ncbi:MAG: metal-dependent hydrolase [Sphingobacteriales bacterium]|nr:metal-dependent hydrolase [Sphingobacteriales bacterium]
MDSFTHIALGACVGEAFFEKGFGKKAMFWGALAQSIPDIDFIANFWMDTPSALLAHRGFTHSFLFMILLIPIFALIADKVHRPHNIRFTKWVLFFLVEISIHLLIDSFNNYGIGWLEPFSHKRFSFNIIYVADPFFSIMPFIAFVFLISLNAYHLNRSRWWKLGLFTPLFYVLFGIFNKMIVDYQVEKNISQSTEKPISYFTTPAPFQNFLWYVVVKKHNGFDIGYYSILDQSNTIQFSRFKQNSNYIDSVDNHEALQKLIRFSEEYYTIKKTKNTLVFNDLRFGQVLGWRNPNSDFVFHYLIEHPEENKLVVQRGRFEAWNVNESIFFFKRIMGN